MKLKSLAEIAFDAHQVFADDDRKFDCPFSGLQTEDRQMFERIADRVYAEVLMRQNPGKRNLAMPNLDGDELPHTD